MQSGICARKLGHLRLRGGITRRVTSRRLDRRHQGKRVSDPRIATTPAAKNRRRLDGSSQDHHRSSLYVAVPRFSSATTPINSTTGRKSVISAGIYDLLSNPERLGIAVSRCLFASLYMEPALSARTCETRSRPNLSSGTSRCTPRDSTAGVLTLSAPSPCHQRQDSDQPQECLFARGHGCRVRAESGCPPRSCGPSRTCALGS